MLKEFDEFVNFCLEHGGTLRNHKAFGEMARELREKIESLEANKTPLSQDACPYCFGIGKSKMSGVYVRCLFCNGTGKRD